MSAPNFDVQFIFCLIGYLSGTTPGPYKPVIDKLFQNPNKQQC